MTLIRRLLGIVVLLTALFGVVLSVGCTVYGRQSLETVAQQTVQTINLAQSNISTTTDALRLAQDTIDNVNDTLATVEVTAVGLSQTVDDTEPLLEQINEITTQRIPDSLQAIEETLPNIVEVAGTVDNTLTALSSFGFRQDFPILGTIDFDLGIDYDPETRFDESIETMGASLEGLPEQLRDLQPQIETTQDNLGTISGNIETLSNDIEAINDNLEEVPDLLEQYITSLATVDSQLDDAVNLIEGQIETAKTGVLIVSIWFGLIQLAPLYMGWMMIIEQSTASLKEDIREDLFEDLTEEIEEQQALASTTTIIADDPIIVTDSDKPFDPNETIVDDSATKS